MRGSLSARGGRSCRLLPSAVWALECSCKDQLFASLAVVLFTTDDIIAIGKQAVPIVCALCCVIIDLFCTPLQLKKALLGPKRFAN